MTESSDTAASQCTGKAAFERLSDAQRAASRLSGRLGQQMSAYACPHCGKLHVGNHLGGKKTATRRRQVE